MLPFLTGRGRHCAAPAADQRKFDRTGIFVLKIYATVSTLTISQDTQADLRAASAPQLYWYLAVHQTETE